MPDAIEPVRWQVTAANLAIFADSLDGLEDLRTATNNRIESLKRVMGHADTAELRRLVSLAESFADLEKQAEKDLAAALKAHPMGDWVNRSIGIGEKQGARLLAAVGGNPYMRPAQKDLDTGEIIAPARPRTRNELWAYCGYHVLRVPSGQVFADDVHVVDAGGNSDDIGQTSAEHIHDEGAGVAPRRKRGERANWSHVARTRAYLVAVSCCKAATSPYRLVYEKGRLQYEDAVHQVQCQNTKRPPKNPKGPIPVNGCGTQAHPELGAPGSPLKPGHQHARALRLVAKEVLEDMWNEARRLQTPQ